MLEKNKSFFFPVWGRRASFASQNGNIQRKEDLRQEYSNSSSNSDFDIKRGEGNYTSLMSSSFAGTETMLKTPLFLGGVF